eukprot:CAMPEP_0178894588 /NCGR_PEP_ID=MMETSP0786-20121207/101_1 /TAXON_ID=186022 /ORGANISM="Thalassionema frauenfeldii, Strain CCMP 1798" /LENGTH=435 /DNA_ID=CAMNT_0020564697 /DNA_START=17 /DNA_END=1321 /DNA_ORIENTATION=+
MRRLEIGLFGIIIVCVAQFFWLPPLSPQEQDTSTNSVRSSNDANDHPKEYVVKRDHINNQETTTSANIDHLPHVVLHVGPHKTGTTSAQYYLQRVKLPLSWNLTIIPEGHNFAVHEQVTPNPASYLNATHNQMTWNNIQQCRQTNNDCHVLVSSEIMTTFSKDEWKALLQKFKGWRVTFVLLHRSFKEKMQSFYFEHNKKYDEYIEIYDTNVHTTYSDFVQSQVKDKGLISDLHQRLQTLSHQVCSTPNGPAQCHVLMESYEDFKRRKVVLAEYLILNATLNLESHSSSKEYNRAKELLQQEAGEHEVSINQSVKNGHLLVDLIKFIHTLFDQNNCGSDGARRRVHAAILARNRNKPIKKKLGKLDLPRVCWNFTTVADKELVYWKENYPSLPLLLDYSICKLDVSRLMAIDVVKEIALLGCPKIGTIFNTTNFF